MVKRSLVNIKEANKRTKIYVGRSLTLHNFCFTIHETHHEKSDWSRAFNQFTIARELDLNSQFTIARELDLVSVLSASTKLRSRFS